MGDICDEDRIIQSNLNCVQAKRLSEVSEFANSLIKDFLSYEDTKFGCVKWIGI